LTFPQSGKTRSQFVREAVGAFGSVREDRSTYGSPCPADPTDITDIAELRQRAIEAAGRFESGVRAAFAFDPHFEEFGYELVVSD